MHNYRRMCIYLFWFTHGNQAETFARSCKSRPELPYGSTHHFRSWQTEVSSRILRYIKILISSDTLGDYKIFLGVLSCRMGLLPPWACPRDQTYCRPLHVNTPWPTCLCKRKKHFVTTVGQLWAFAWRPATPQNLGATTKMSEHISDTNGIEDTTRRRLLRWNSSSVFLKAPWVSTCQLWSCPIEIFMC